jgi:hypothetical protein
MEELLKNYINHIESNISPILSNELNKILKTNLENNIEIEEIEIKIKEAFIKYIKEMSSKDIGNTAKRIYDSYVDYDDNNLIRSIRFLKRIREKFSNFRLSKYFTNWRILSMINKKDNFDLNYKNNNNNNDIDTYNKNSMENNRNLSKQNNNKNKNSKEEVNEISNKRGKERERNIEMEIEIEKKTNYNTIDIKENRKYNKTFNSEISTFNNNRNTISNNNMEKNTNNNSNNNNLFNDYNKIDNTNNLSKNHKNNNNVNNKNNCSASVFDKLYLESFKKKDVILLNEEIKKISEMDECTFIPNISRK